MRRNTHRTGRESTRPPARPWAAKWRLSIVLLATLAGLIAVSAGAEVGAQRHTCGGIAATIVGTSGPDRITGTSGRDVIVSLGGADVVRGRGGNDLICTGTGQDTVFGGSGRDRIWGGRGDDRILGQRGRDVIRGGPGEDFLYGGGRGDRIEGGRGHDSIFGLSGNDRGFGGRGTDSCVTEAQSSCERRSLTPTSSARAFITAAIEGDPVVHMFTGQEAYFRDGNTDAVPSVRPSPDARPAAKRAHDHFDRFRGTPYVITGLSSSTCAEWIGGDLSYPCQFTVSAQGVGLTEVSLTMNFGHQLYGWTPVRVAKPCGRLQGPGEPLDIVMDGTPASCRRGLRIVDRYLNDDSIDRQGSGAFAFVDGWSCSARSGTVAMLSGVGGSCDDPSGASAIFCETEFSPTPGVSPGSLDTRADTCALVR